MKITFHGGAGTVTGSNYLLETDNIKILIDCGLHQGSNHYEKSNFEPFAYDPKTIEAVFITHAHIDHIGRLPKLYKSGFRGKIFSTAPTKDFAKELLLDSEHLSKFNSKENFSLYTIEDIDKTMELWQTTSYHKKIKVGQNNDELEVEFFDAGHILGSAFISIREIATGKKIIFSGDLGNVATPLSKETENFEKADYVLIESAYGDRIHENLTNRKDLLEDAIEDAHKSGGVLMIPSFAMERTQDLLFEMDDLIENDRVPKEPVFIDSPLAIKLTEIYRKYIHDPDYFDEKILKITAKKKDIFNFPNLKICLTKEQSKGINDVPSPKTIVAGSGMSQGGRILHHEIRYLPDPKSLILFIGYQTKGSLGRLILDGAEYVKIFGEEVTVRCQKRQISGYSAHADQKKLLDWLRPARFSLKKVFVVQGEEDQSQTLAQKITDDFAIEAIVPSQGESFML